MNKAYGNKSLAAKLYERNKAYDELMNYEDFKWGKQEQADSLLNDITTRPKFSYDMNADALYQQYKDKHIQQGRMAMEDAIGQASAMTGGYGNSYAATVGNQAYQTQLNNLNGIVPELYQMAYDQYAQEGKDLQNQYDMLIKDYDKYAKDWSTGYKNAKEKYDIANSEYEMAALGDTGDSGVLTTDSDTNAITKRYGVTNRKNANSFIKNHLNKSEWGGYGNDPEEYKNYIKAEIEANEDILSDDEILYLIKHYGLSE